MSRLSTKTLFDVGFGVVVMGTVGALIGTILGGSSVPIAAGLGLMLGAVVGSLGGRRFLVSILVGTVLGGLLAWLVAGFEKISFGAGAGAAAASEDSTALVGTPGAVVRTAGSARPHSSSTSRRSASR